MRISVIAGAVLLIAGSAVAVAQTAAPVPAKQEARAAQRAALKAAWKEKKAECRQSGAARGLSRVNLKDHVRICVTEAKLACFRQLAEQNLTGPRRREFLVRCADRA